MPNLDLSWIFDLLSNPGIAALVASLLSPLLAGIPWLTPVLNIVARIAGYQLVPIVTPKAQAKQTAAAKLHEAIEASRSDPSEANAVRLAAAQAEHSALQGGILDFVKDNPLILVAIIGGVLFMTMGKGCNKPAPTPAVKQVSLQ